MKKNLSHSHCRSRTRFDALDGLTEENDKGVVQVVVVTFSVGFRFEDAGSRDNGIGACFEDEIRIFGCHSAIHLDPWIGSLFLAHLSESLNLGHLVRDEFLTTEPRIDRHDQDQVSNGHNVLDQAQRSCRIQNDAGLTSQIFNL